MKIITSESVFKGHPDKICDQISDAILDALLAEDSKSKVAVECAIKDNNLFILGEVTTNAKVDYSLIASRILKDLGYKNIFNIHVKISLQSRDIAIGVNETDDRPQGAGDQGIMYGYACDETPELMPLPIILAHKIAKEMDILRKKYPSILESDGKCQVTVKYDPNPIIDTIVISAQTKPKTEIAQLESVIREEILPALDYDLTKTKILINPTGVFETGGSYADSGLTGRKIIVDTYGGVGRHGGGAFSGKDPSKVDRSAAYYCRYIAKSIIAAELAKECEVSVAYAIGISEPVGIGINTFNTGIIGDAELLDLVRRHFDFRPANMIQELQLLQTSYSPLSCFGHVGRDDLPVLWERVETKSDDLKRDYEATNY